MTAPCWHCVKILQQFQSLILERPYITEICSPVALYEISVFNDEPEAFLETALVILRKDQTILFIYNCLARSAAVTAYDEHVIIYSLSYNQAETFLAHRGEKQDVNFPVHLVHLVMRGISINFRVKRPFILLHIALIATFSCCVYKDELEVLYILA